MELTPLNRLNLPYETLPVSVDAIEKRYAQALLDGKREGWTPLILLTDTDAEALSFSIDDAEIRYDSLSGFTKRTLSDANNIDPHTYMADELDEYFSQDVNEDDADADAELTDGFVLMPDIEGAYLLHVPCVNPWEVFAYIPFGNFNDCPENAAHCAFARYFWEKFGAMPMAIGPDFVEYRLREPASEADIDVRLIAAYCLTYLEYIPISSIPRCLAAVRTWFFWYD